MKNLLKWTHIICMLFVTINTVQAQYEGKHKNVEISDISKERDYILIDLEDDERELYFDSDSKCFNKKDNIEKEELEGGMNVDVTYFFDVENERWIIKELRLKSKENAGKSTLKGILEFVDGDIAYLDGRPVKKKDKSILIMPKKSKDKPYAKFEKVKLGKKIKVVGSEGKDGILYAEKIVVSENKYTENDRGLHADLLKRSGDSTQILTQSKYTCSLHQGTLNLGGVSYKLFNDIDVQGIVNTIGYNVIPDYAKDSEYQRAHRLDFKFYVIESPIPNAAALGNGTIYIHTGLLELIENEAQLAAVLGHEIAHVLHKHPSKRYMRYKLGEKGRRTVEWLKARLLGKNKKGTAKPKLLNEVFKGGVNGLLNSITSESISNVQSRKEEKQADRAGLMYAYQSGYDIREANRLWEILEMETNKTEFKSKVTGHLTQFMSSSQVGFKKDAERRGFSFDTPSLESFTEGIVQMSLKEWAFVSHPKVKKRKKYIEETIDKVYKNMDFSNAIKGDKEFMESLAVLK